MHVTDVSSGQIVGGWQLRGQVQACEPHFLQMRWQCIWDSPSCRHQPGLAVTFMSSQGFTPPRMRTGLLAVSQERRRGGPQPRDPLWENGAALRMPAPTGRLDKTYRFPCTWKHPINLSPFFLLWEWRWAVGLQQWAINNHWRKKWTMRDYSCWAFQFCLPR